MTWGVGVDEPEKALEGTDSPLLEAQARMYTQKTASSPTSQA